MDKPIRILHVLGRLDRGGAETMVMNLYRNIDRSKIQFDFIIHTTDICDYTDEILELGGKIYSICPFSFRNCLKYLKEWNQFLKTKSDYKVIHGHVRSTAAIYLFIANRYQISTIAHSHSTSSGTGIAAIIKRILQYPIRYIAKYLVACSEASGIWLFGKHACNSKKFFVFKNAIDIDKFIYSPHYRKDIEEEFNLNNKFVIGHIGRFHESKNHDFIVELFDEVQKQYNNCILMLVGTGPLENQIKNKIKMLGLEERVIFTGVRSDIHKIIQRMDLFLFPSRYEGFPVTLIETQASGLKCLVSSNITKEVALVNNIEYIDLENKMQWVIKIKQYLETYKERKDCTQIENIKDRGFDIQSNAEQILNFYINLVL